MADLDALPNVLTFPKTLELEQRLARAEVTLAELRESVAGKDAEIASLKDAVNMLYRRVTSLQAQLEHVFAKSDPY